MDYKDAEQEILKRLDLQAELAAAGVEFVRNEPSASGWIPCRAVGREDTHPSAAVCVAGENGSLGRYKDSGTGEVLSFWDLMVKLGYFRTWKEARNHYAKETGVPLPSDGRRANPAGAESRKRAAKEASRDAAPDLEDLVHISAMQGKPFVYRFVPFATSNPPIAPEVVAEYGIACCTRSFPQPRNQRVVAWSFGLAPGRKPRGWLFTRLDGKKFPATKNRPVKKILSSPKAKCGFLFGGANLKTAKRVIIVEGLKDWLAVLSRGVAADTAVVATSHGAGVWPTTRGRRPCTKPFDGKIIFICGDCDTAGQRGMWKFARILASVAAAVYTITLPFKITESGGKDTRDWFLEDASRTVDELLDLAEPFTSDVSGPCRLADSQPAYKPNERPDDPHRLARICRSEMPDLRFWREDFFIFESPAYRRLSTAEVKAEITRIVKAEFDRLNIEAQENADADGAQDDEGDDSRESVARKVTRTLVNDVTNALHSLCILPDRVEEPCWLNENENPAPADDVIVTSNAIVHPKSAIAGADCTLPPTPALFSVNHLPYAYDRAAACPQWLAFLRSLWEHQPEQIDTLQEIMGYLLLPDTSLQKMFMLIGPKRSGKGTIARVIRGLVGEHNICAPTLGSLQEQFGLQPLVGKTVAIVGDARLSGRADESVIVERLLSITGEDAQTVNRKYRDQVTMQLKTRFLLLSNELPRLRDASATLASRLIILRFTESFYDREDHGLTQRLLQELPGILNWSLAGWKRLRERGHFDQPAAGRQLLDQMEEMASPVLAFVRERCDVTSDGQIEKAQLFNAWKSWSEVRGLKAGADSTFARNLMAAVPSVDSARPRDDTGKRVNVYTGIKLKEGDWS